MTLLPTGVAVPLRAATVVRNPEPATSSSSSRGPEGTPLRTMQMGRNVHAFAHFRGEVSFSAWRANPPCRERPRLTQPRWRRRGRSRIRYLVCGFHSGSCCSAFQAPSGVFLGGADRSRRRPRADSHGRPGCHPERSFPAALPSPWPEEGGRTTPQGRGEHHRTTL